MKKTRNGRELCVHLSPRHLGSLILVVVSMHSRELSSQFQKTIEEVSTKMDQQGKDYVASLRENEK